MPKGVFTRKPITEKHRINLTIAARRRAERERGKTLSVEHRAKISSALKGIIRPSGEENVTWKGESASYSAKHHWLKYHFGVAKKCENIDCYYPRRNSSRTWIISPKRFEWALRRGRSYTKNPSDYIQLCPSCHRSYDLGLLEINEAEYKRKYKKDS